MDFNKLLSLFDGEGAAEGSDSADLAQQQNEEPVEENLDADFEALIKGKYKEQYDKRFQKAFDQRHKDYKQTKETLDSLNPMLDMLKGKYGVQDIAELQNAIMDDDSYYEQEAMERGYTVEQLKHIKQLERDNANYLAQQQQMAQQKAAEEQISRWVQQEQAFKQEVPTFDLRSELQDPAFERLLGSGVDVKTAYNVIHMDEIMQGSMNYAAAKATERTVNSIKAKGTRPDEIGLHKQQGDPGKKRISDMSGDEILELANRAKRGERITF